MEPSLTNYLNNSVAEKNNRINVPQGPQFKTWGGPGIAMIFLMFLLVSIVSLIQREFLIAVGCIIITIMLLYLVLDFRGIEVDTGNHKIKDYKLFLWIKIGKWSDIKDFKTIYITSKNVTVRTSLYSGNSSETYHYYHIKLVDEATHKEIFLAEYKNYYKAQKIAMNISNVTGLELKDFLKGGKRDRH